jgi:hypothetical protein
MLVAPRAMLEPPRAMLERPGAMLEAPRAMLEARRAMRIALRARPERAEPLSSSRPESENGPPALLLPPRPPPLRVLRVSPSSRSGLPLRTPSYLVPSACCLVPEPPGGVGDRPERPGAQQKRGHIGPSVTGSPGREAPPTRELQSAGRGALAPGDEAATMSLSSGTREPWLDRATTTHHPTRPPPSIPGLPTAGSARGVLV